MPAKSVAQQQLMAMAYALKKGEMKSDEASQEVKDLAAGMTLKQLRDYAETSHEGLPDKVKESGLTGFLSAGPFPRLNSYPQNIATQWVSTLRDRQDTMIQSFLDFISTKDKKKKDDEEANEGAVLGLPGVATPQGTPGMGNVTPPSAGNVGSGDRFDNGSEDDEDKIGILSYEDYKKWVKKWQKQKAQK
jgi:hypothetical protein